MQGGTKMKQWGSLVLFLCGVVFFAVSCGGGKDAADDAGAPRDAVASVSGFFEELPSWEEFSPPLDDEHSQLPMEEADCPNGEIVGDNCEETEEVNDVPVEDENGIVLGHEDYVCICTTKKYNMVDTPEKLVMLSPDVELLWPGALIQGKSHRDGLGSLLGLPIRERNPLMVSIPALATVQQAVGSMIGNASDQELVTPSTISFEMKTYNSEEEFALSLGMSARYLKFSATADVEVDTSVVKTTVAVKLYQKMFEVVVEPPQTPMDFFSDVFTPEVLQQQVDMGRIGADNLPVYVSNIVYGRIMMFTFTSTESETDIKAALTAAYEGTGVSGSLDLDTNYRKILSEGQVSITSLGGNASATAAMITSGDWRSYFHERVCTDPGDETTCAYVPGNAPLSSAAPLSYTFRNLVDGSIAARTRHSFEPVSTNSTTTPQRRTSTRPLKGGRRWGRPGSTWGFRPTKGTC
jgi:hypothetical protein